jgi:hypothetical protein
MYNEPRDESLPRVSDIIKFIDQDEFESIPDKVLAIASERGTQTHNMLEKYYHTDLNNYQLKMLKEAVTYLKPKGEPVFEHQLNGKLFTGKPDMYFDVLLNDFKTGDLKEKAALQEAGYDILLEEKTGRRKDRWVISHFHQDIGLFLYEVPKTAHADLRDFFKYLVANHDEIFDGGFERYTALERWEELLLVHDVLTPLKTFLPDPIINSPEEARNAMYIYRGLLIVEKQKDKYKRELKRWMQENEVKTLELHGKGLRLQRGGKQAVFNIPKDVAKRQKEEKAKYQTGSILKSPSLYPYDVT